MTDITSERIRPDRIRSSGTAALTSRVQSHLADGAVDGNDGQVLAIGRHDSVVGDALRSSGWPVSNLVLTGARDEFSGIDEPCDGVGFAACVLDGVLSPTTKPSELLAHCYDVLRPGGLLVVVLEETRRDIRSSRRRRTGHGPFTGETLPALLFREGFERPRFHSDRTRTIAVAHRSELAPPYLRPQRLTVIMPVFNEHHTFRKAMDALLGKTIPGIEIEFIIVESNSTDGTRADVLEYSEHPRVRIILEDHPQGKGHAVRVGLAQADGDFVIIQDADLEYDIDDYDSLLEPLRQFEVGFVLGMRTSPDGSWGMRQFGERNFVSRIMNLGHVGFLMLFNVVYGQRLHDPFTMYKVMRRDCLYGLTFECNRFDFDWELTAKLIRAGYVPRELPASYESRSFTEGKKVSFFGDPLTWIVACFKYRFVKLYR
jgi:hypothetical protein